MGLNPRPTSIAAVMATGVPNPAEPSIKAPKENAINNACNLRSSVIDAMESLIISNCPVFTVSWYKNTAVIIIQPMGKIPVIAPYSEEYTESPTGI